MIAKNTLDYLFSIPPVSGEKSYLRPRLELMKHAVYLAGKGAVMEFGVAEGVSARHLINILPEDTPIFLFDSFEGLPEDWCGLRKKGKYKVDEIPVFDESNVTLVKGRFEDTLPEFEFNGELSLIHIDCDIYSSTKTVIEYIGKHIKPGTLILFDEYFNYQYFAEHEYKAFNEWIDTSGFDFEYIARTLNGQALVKITEAGHD